MRVTITKTAVLVLLITLFSAVIAAATYTFTDETTGDALSYDSGSFVFTADGVRLARLNAFVGLDISNISGGFTDPVITGGPGGMALKFQSEPQQFYFTNNTHTFLGIGNTQLGVGLDISNVSGTPSLLAGNGVQMRFRPDDQQTTFLDTTGTRVIIDTSQGILVRNTNDASVVTLGSPSGSGDGGLSLFGNAQGTNGASLQVNYDEPNNRMNVVSNSTTIMRVDKNSFNLRVSGVPTNVQLLEYDQNSEPDIATNSVALWHNSSVIEEFKLIWDFNGTQRSVTFS